MRRRGLHRRRRICWKRRRRNATGAEPAVIARFNGQQTRPHRVPPSLHRARFARHPRRPRHAGARHRRRPYGSRTWPGGLRCRHAIRPARLLPGRSRWPLLRCRRAAAGTFPTQLIGKTVWEGNPIVIDILKSAARCWRLEHIDHSYPHCWRCHNATIFRATDQWFIGMDNNGLRQQALDAIKAVKWMPEWGEERISNMVVDAAPTGAFRASASGACPSSSSIANNAASRSPTARSSTAWWIFSRSTPPTSGSSAPPPNSCPPEPSARNAARRNSRKENDILDVWFDSGSSHLAVLTEEERPSLARRPLSRRRRPISRLVPEFPADWRGSARQAPYRACAHPRLDAGWRWPRRCRNPSATASRPKKSSRTTAPRLIRLWTASVDFIEDVRISPDHPDAPVGGLPQAPQHVPLRPRQPARLRSGAATPCPATTAGNRPVDSGARRRSGRALPHLVRRIRVP